MYISYTMVAALRDNRPVAYRDGIAIFGNISPYNVIRWTNFELKSSADIMYALANKNPSSLSSPYNEHGCLPNLAIPIALC